MTTPRRPRVSEEHAVNRAMPQIENIVFVMMENRSLDNLLGWLYETSAPQHYYPADNRTPYDGLVAGRYHNPARSWTGGVHQYPVVPIPSKHEKKRVPAYDPYEAFREGASPEWNGVMNQCFGNEDRIGVMPKPPAAARMLGFLQDYYARYMVDWQGLDVLWTYTPAQLPLINSLARHYAVSDRWFSSVPTQTNPNRAYSICGTSAGREANANLQANEHYDLPTIFNKLADAGKSWGLYYEDIWHDKKCFTEYTFPHMSSAGNGEVGTMSQFKASAANGTLPSFTYLEPKWGYGKGTLYVQGDDYHPPTLVAPGDQFLWDTYLAIRNGPQWSKTLFIVTFDEHGGTYDHVGPPWTAINPDGITGTKWGFKFDLYGTRVPTLLISPYIAPRTVFRAPSGSALPFDHTSFISTLLLWAGVSPATAGMGKRVASAPRFDGVLSSTPVNTSDVTQKPVAFEPVAVARPEAPAEAPPAGQQLNALFEGMPFASVRAILGRSESIEDAHAALATFRKDPDKFEATLGD